MLVERDPRIERIERNGKDSFSVYTEEVVWEDCHIGKFRIDVEWPTRKVRYYNLSGTKMTPLSGWGIRGPVHHLHPNLAWVNKDGESWSEFQPCGIDEVGVWSAPCHFLDDYAMEMLWVKEDAIGMVLQLVDPLFNKRFTYDDYWSIRELWKKGDGDEEMADHQGEGENRRGGDEAAPGDPTLRLRRALGRE